MNKPTYSILLYTTVPGDDEGYYSEKLSESDSLETIMESWFELKQEVYQEDDDCISLFKDDENLLEFYLREESK